MPGWVTRVKFTGAFQIEFHAALNAENRRKVIWWPYRLLSGVAVLEDWAWVRARIDANGEQYVWCRLDVPDDPQAGHTGATYYPDAIPDIPPYDPPAVPVDGQYKTDLLAAANTFIALIENPEWANFVARFRQMTFEEIQTTATFEKAMLIRDRMGELVNV